MTLLKIGSTGEAVRALQTALGVSVDGIFGPKTFLALEAFQRANGLVPDGIYGPLTAAALVGGGIPPVEVPDGEMATGIDIYHGDEINSWDKIRRAGFDFVFIKASQGLGTDPKYKSFKEEADAAGLITGPYHFISFSQDTKEQARHFASLIKGLKKTDLPPVLDFEYLPGHNPKPSDATVARVFLEEISQLTSRLPVFYCSRSVPGEIGAPSFLKDYPLWLASYNSSIRVPAPWNTWAFWQYSDSARVPGIGNNADVNRFNGDVASLRKFIERT